MQEERQPLISPDIVHHGSFDNPHTTASKQCNDTLDKDSPQSIHNTQTSSGYADIALYHRRWYLLMILMLIGVEKALGYNIWGPISESTQAAFLWSNSDIAMMPNWVSVAGVFTILPASWFMDVKGLRYACILSSGLLVMSAGLRCLPFEPVSQSYKWSVYAGQVCNGFAAFFPLGSPPKFSAVWFPTNQRTTATALAIVGPIIGGAFSFLIGPMMVPSYNSTAWNHTHITTSIAVTNTTDNPTIKDVQKQIMLYMYTQLIASVIIFILVLIYFPSCPPKPPSLSAQIERQDYLRGFKDLCKSPSFWMVAVPTTTIGGIWGWTAVLAIDMESQPFSQLEIGWIGFWSSIAGGAASLVVARCTDIFAGRLKSSILAAMLMCTVSFALFTSMNQKVIGLAPIRSLFYVSIVGATVFVNVAYPLFLELACEMVYPVSEGVTASFIVTLVYAWGSIFYFVFLIPDIGTVWIDWFVVTGIVISILCMLIVKPKYRRSEVDTRLNLLPKEEITEILDDTTGTVSS